MIDLWWTRGRAQPGAPAHQPCPGRHGDRRYRRNRYEYYAGIGSLPDAVAPNLRNRVVADDRRDRQHERRRCRRDREPRQRERWVRGLRQRRTPLLRGQLPRHRDHDRARGRRSAPVSAHGEVHLRVDRNVRRRRGGRAVPRRHAGWRRHDPAHHADLVRHVRVRSRLPARAVDHDRLRRAVSRSRPVRSARSRSTSRGEPHAMPPRKPASRTPSSSPALPRRSRVE